MYTLPVACSRWPVAVADAPALTLIAAGGTHTCGLDANAFAYCWGANHFGQLGTGSRSEQPLRPTPVAQGYVFQSLTAGGNHTCGLTTEGRIVCWGQNNEGQLGNGSGGLYQWSTPVAVAVDVTFRAVSAGTEHTCGLSVDGLTYCWGANASGQLGDGSHERRLVPTPTAGGVTFATVSAGSTNTCGLATDGLVYCWDTGWGATPVPVARQR